MGLETRNQRTYYYRKLRDGEKVISLYCGAGDLARLMSVLDGQERNESARVSLRKRQAFEEEKRIHDEVDGLVEELCEKVELMMDALFLANGYHQHSRQWRRKSK